MRVTHAAKIFVPMRLYPILTLLIAFFSSSACSQRVAVPPVLFRLCPPLRASRGHQNTAETIELARLQGAFGIRARVTQLVSPGGPSSCMSVQFTDPHVNLGLVRSLLSHRGQLVVGSARGLRYVALGRRVRFTTDERTTRSRDLPTLSPIILGRDVIQPHVLQADPDNKVVSYRLTIGASRRWCTFTSRNEGRTVFLVLDRQVIAAASIATPICGGVQLLPEFAGPVAVTPRMLVSYLKSGPLPFSWRSVRDTAVSSGSSGS